MKKHGTGEEKQIAWMTITNDGTGGTGPRGNYDYKIWGKRCGVPMHEGHIQGFKRKARHVLDLLKLIFMDARGKDG